MYDQAISRRTPACVVFLLDRSDSMGMRWGGSQMTLAEGAAQAINRVLFDLAVRSTKEPGAPLRPYFYTGVFTYGLRVSDGGEGVESGWGGRMAGRGIVPLPDLAQNPVRMREMVAADLMPTSRMPEWIIPAHGNRTPMCEAIAHAGKHVFAWADQFPDSFPPIVMNITDGWVTDNPYLDTDLGGWAQRLRGIRTRDGSVLLLNVFLSPVQAPTAWFPTHPGHLPPPGPDLFNITSELPPPMIQNAQSAGVPARPGSRGLVFNADLSMLSTFLEIGTRFRVNDR